MYDDEDDDDNEVITEEQAAAPAETPAAAVDGNSGDESVNSLLGGVAPTPSILPAGRDGALGADLCVTAADLLPLPDEDIFQELGNVVKQRRVYRYFMEGMDLVTCAEKACMPLRTVLHWADVGKWPDRRERLIRAQARDESQQLAKLRMEKRRPELEAQIATGQKLRRAIDATLDSREDLSPGNLMALGQAAKAAGDLTVRAMGVGESGATSDEEAAVKEKAGKTPLVLVFHGPAGLPPIRASKTVDVETE